MRILGRGLEPGWEVLVGGVVGVRGCACGAFRRLAPPSFLRAKKPTAEGLKAAEGLDLCPGLDLDAWLSPAGLRVDCTGMGMVGTTFRFPGTAPKLEEIQEQVERALGSQVKVEVHEYRWDMRGTGAPASVVAPVGGPGPFDIRDARWSSRESFVELKQIMPSGVLHVNAHFSVDPRMYQLTCDAIRSLGGVEDEISPQERKRMVVGLIAIYAFCAVVLATGAIVAWYWGTRWAWIVTGAILVGIVVGIVALVWCKVRQIMRRDAEIAAREGSGIGGQ